MAASKRPESPPPVDIIPDDEDGRADDAEIPLTMTASVVLTSLPKDARSALRDAGREIDSEQKGTLSQCRRSTL
jgi:ubiquitin-like protein ATG12